MTMLNANPHSAQIMPRASILLRPRDANDDRAYPALDSPLAFKEYFEREGFILMRRAVQAPLCEGAKQAFLQEAFLDKQAFFVRHASGTYERHVYTDQGFMKFPIMNLQDISGKKYPQFKRRGLDLLTQVSIKRAMEVLFGEPGRMIHTMYFDGNQTTWAHRDGHYIDSEHAGAMVGVWVAAEDIHPDSGRFFILPRSHRMALPGEDKNPNGPAYKAMMAQFVREGPLDCVAPILEQGDVLLWTSLTIHGSLPSTNPKFSRRSFTAHYVPQSHQFKRQVARHVAPRSIMVNDVAVSLQRDHDSLAGTLKDALRSDFPRLYWMIRRAKETLSFAHSRAAQ
ncbi:MAG: phytanoyl-CoA dioxygenase family protein [Pseudomonadota bacterium]